LRICLKFNGIENAWLVLFCLFSAAANFSYSVKERFFFQLPHAPHNGMGIQTCFLMYPGYPAPSVLSGKTPSINSSLPLIEMAHGLHMKLSSIVHTPTIASDKRFVKLFKIVHLGLTTNVSTPMN